MKTQRRVISVAPEQFDQVTGELERQGFQIDNRMPDAGAVSGDLGSADEAELRKIPGVQGVEEDGGYQLPPPDSPVQ